MVLGHVGSPLFLVGFPEHPVLIRWQCFPRASQFRALRFMAELPNLTRWLLGGEGYSLVLLQPDVEVEKEKREGEDCCLSPAWVPPTQTSPSSVATACLWPLEGGVPPRKLSLGTAGSAASAGP